MKNTNTKIDIVLIIFNILLMSGIFTFDLMLERGYAVAISYIVVIMLSLWLKKLSYTLCFSISCIILTIVGYYLSPLDDDINEAIFNRSIITFAIIATTLLTLFRKKNRLEKEKILYNMSHFDELTQIYNRRYFNSQFEKYWKLSIRENKSLAIILIDVDYFKLYNDTLGHKAGDDCLRKIAEALSLQPKRPTDHIARYGGEEFVALLPNTDLEGSLLLADKMLEAIQSLEIEHPASKISKYITASLGCSALQPSNDIRPEILLLQADKALYYSKEQGRNRISSYFPEMD